MHTHNRQFAAGTAMTEMVLALPFLATVVSFIFFFGWAMLHKQQVIMASRYAAWETIYNGTPSEDRTNEVAMASKGVNVVITPSNAEVTTMQDLLGQISQGAQPLADATIGEAFPGGTDVRASADFLALQPRAGARFSPTISSHHSRDGVTWVLDDVSCWNALRTLYLSDLDQSLETADPVAAGMVGMIQNLYLGYWGRPTQ